MALPYNGALVLSRSHFLSLSLSLSPSLSLSLSLSLALSLWLSVCVPLLPPLPPSQEWPGLSETAKLDSCHVRKLYQGSGHGTRVMAFLLRMFAKSGANTIRISAPTSKATQFYKKLGFSHDRGMQIYTIWLSKAWVRSNWLFLFAFISCALLGSCCMQRQPDNERRVPGVCAVQAL